MKMILATFKELNCTHANEAILIQKSEKIEDSDFD